MTLISDRQIRVISMVGGIDLIGEVEITDQDTARIYRPASFRCHIADGKTNVTFFDMMSGGIFAGDYIELNMRALLWSGRPSKPLANGYQAHRAGLLLPASMPGEAPAARQ